MLLHDLLTAAAMRSPDKLAAVFNREQATFAAIREQSLKVAARLKRLGIGPGSRVAVLYDNSLAALAYYWGVLQSGAATADVSTTAGQAAIEGVLEELRPDALAAQPQLLRRMVADGWSGCPKVLLSTTEASDTIAPLLAAGTSFHALEEILETEFEADRLPRPDPSSVAMIIYTSGTTGRPKGVMLSHANLLFNVIAFNERIGLTSEDSLLLVAPLNYIHGRIQLLTHTMLGATIFFSAGFRFPQEVVLELEKYAPTGFSGVPFHFSTLLANSKLKTTPLPRLRNIMITGGALPPHRLRELQDAVPNAAIHVNYGLTESSPRLTYHGPSHEVFARPTSCGRALPGVTIEILGADGQPLPPGLVGEVVASGPGIMKGYVSGDERTSGRIDAQGRLRTGDLGHLDAEGYLFLSGRSSEMIKSAGERIFPREIEEVLQAHPSVGEAAVFGVPDPVLGERIVACVVPAPGHAPSVQVLKTHCLKSLSYVRTPKEIYVVQDLPKTVSGKTLRDALRAKVLSYLGDAPRTQVTIESHVVQQATNP
ncbi:class I adenylate-forming enzyme family protein [Sorangium sp. So ce233]|uniref:class I adenylate-forming enzyme family protein n=1 Tax=Sorangium sp. So ce233 TaxID=3133290 RepID=UPI003F6431F6